MRRSARARSVLWASAGAARAAAGAPRTSRAPAGTPGPSRTSRPAGTARPASRPGSGPLGARSARPVSHVRGRPVHVGSAVEGRPCAGRWPPRIETGLIEGPGKHRRSRAHRRPAPRPRPSMRWGPGTCVGRQPAVHPHVTLRVERAAPVVAVPVAAQCEGDDRDPEPGRIAEQWPLGALEVVGELGGKGPATVASEQHIAPAPV